MQLREGETFAAAAAAHPEAFPRYYVAVLESAELTGTLDKVLNELAEYMEREVDARSQLTSALDLPRRRRGACRGHRDHPGDLRPAEVQDLLRVPEREAAASDAHAAQHLQLRQHIVGGRFSASSWLIVGGRRGPQEVRLRQGEARRPVPEASGRRRRWCRPPSSSGSAACSSSLVTAGVDLPRAMAVTAESSNNVVYRDGINHIREQMMEGNGLAEPLD